MRSLATAAVALAVLPAFAQAPAPPSPREVALELVRISGVEETMRLGIASSLDAQIQANPALEPYRAVIEEWATSVVEGEKLAERFADLYLELFDESELRALLEFQRSPLGRKVKEKNGELMRRASEIGLEAATRHEADLDRRIRAKAAELGQETP